MASLGVGSLKINRIQELGEWENASEKVALTEDESLQAYLDYIPQYFEDGAPLDLILDGAFTYLRSEPELVGMEYERPCAQTLEAERRLSCGILKSGMYLGSDGAVCPCMSMTDSKLNDLPNAFQTPLRDILGDTPFMHRCATTIGQVRDGNGECRSCEFVDKCNGGCRAMAVCSAPSMTAPDPSNCHFYRNGWYERFKQASRASLDVYLAAHPEAMKRSDAPEGEREDREFGI